MHLFLFCLQLNKTVYNVDNQMIIVFLSNYFNHHQTSLSAQLYEQTNHQYFFIETAKISDERIKLGWGGDAKPEYVKYYLQDEYTRRFCDSVIYDADVVIIGSAPDILIKRRLKQGKLVFRYSERPLKKGLELYKYPYRYFKWHRINNRSFNIYMLSASSFTSADYAKFGLFENRCFKWGYFPETKKYDVDDLIQGKDRKRILWAGRFLDWKHPDDVLHVAKKLKDDGLTFTMDIVGTGIMDSKLKEMSVSLGLTDCVNFIGSVPANQVRTLMEKAGIYLFTSDRYEGWGAVLNESMNSGCAIVASHAIGSVPFLMKNKGNGIVYHSGDVGELFKKVQYLLENPDYQAQIGKTAYHTITEEWNAETAAERLISLAEHILAGEKHLDLYQTGPCSKAEIIKDDWFCE